MFIETHILFLSTVSVIFVLFTFILLHRKKSIESLVIFEKYTNDLRLVDEKSGFIESVTPCESQLDSNLKVYNFSEVLMLENVKSKFISMIIKYGYKKQVVHSLTILSPSNCAAIQLAVEKS